MIIFFLFLVSSRIVPLGYVGAYLKLLLIDKPKLDIISITRSKYKKPPLLYSTTNSHDDDTENVSFFPSSSFSSSSSMNTATSYNYTLSHKYSFNIPNPSYVQILKDGFLSVTSFSFLKKGSINQFDLGTTTTTNNNNNNRGGSSRSGVVSDSICRDRDRDSSNSNNNSDDSKSSSSSMNSKTKTKISNNSNPPAPHTTSIPQLTHSKRYNGEYLWPNELTSFQDLSGNKMTIIPDGFLFPGQDDGGLYMIQEPAMARSSSSAAASLSSDNGLDLKNISEDNDDKTTTTATNNNNNHHSHRQHRTSLLSSIEAEAAAEAAAQFPIRITANKKGWFYHRAVYVRLPIPETTLTASSATTSSATTSSTTTSSTAGTTIDTVTPTPSPPRRYREGILTARAYKPLFGRGRGELVWINLPTATTTAKTTTTLTTKSVESKHESKSELNDDPSSKRLQKERNDITSSNSGGINNISNSAENDSNEEIAINYDDNDDDNDIDDEWIPWQETVLVEGPDVMFETVDIDPSDNSIEIISAHFFGQKITVHSLEAFPSLSQTTLKSTTSTENTESSPSSSSSSSSSGSKKKQRRRPLIKISDTYLLDNAVGQPYGLCLASMPSLALTSSTPSTTTTSLQSSVQQSLPSSKSSSEAAAVPSPLQQQQQSQVDSTALFELQSGISPHTTSSNSGGDSAGRGQVGLRASNKKKVATAAITQLNVHKSESSIISNSIDAKSISVTPVPLSLSPTTATTTAAPSSLISSTTAASALPVPTPPIYTHLLVTTHECSYDIWSTIKMAVLAVFGRYPRIRAGAAVQHEYSRRYLGRSRGGTTTNTNGIIGSGGGSFSSGDSSSINGMNSDTSIDLLSSSLSTAVVITENMMRSRSESTTSSINNINVGHYTINQKQKQRDKTQSNNNNTNNKSINRRKGLWSGVGESFFGAGGNLFGVEGMFFSSMSKQLASSKAGVGGSLFAYELPRLRRHPISSRGSSGSNNNSSIGQQQSQQSATIKDSQFKNNIPSSIESSINLKLSSSSSPTAKSTSQAARSISTSSSTTTTSNNIVQDVIDTYDTPRYLSWRRHTLCTGFKVKGWGGIFSPGAPGFPYVFNMPHQYQHQAVSSSSSVESTNGVAAEATTTTSTVPPPMPLILLAGDCTGSAYIFTPRTSGSSASAVSAANNNINNKSVPTVNTASATTTTITTSPPTRKATTRKSLKKGNKNKFDKNTIEIYEKEEVDEEEEEEEVLLAPVYDLAFEIECGATVGSAAAAVATDGTNSVDIFLPSYELNQIHALRLSLNEHHQQQQ